MHLCSLRENADLKDDGVHYLVEHIVTAVNKYRGITVQPDGAQGPAGTTGPTGPTAQNPAESIYSAMRLRALDLADCALTDSGISALARLLDANAPLDTLDLTGNSHVQTEGWHTFARALAHNSELTTLVLSFCLLSDIKFKVLLEGVAANRSLRYLYVDNNVLQQEAAALLLELLRARGPQANRVLERVALEPGNAIPAETLAAIRAELAKRAPF